MSKSEARHSRRRGKYAVRACNSCRRLSGYECTWIPEAEEDRPVTKQLVEALRAKAHQLEFEIALLKQTDTQNLPSSATVLPDVEFLHPLPDFIALSESQSHVNIDSGDSALHVDYVLLQSPDQFHSALAPPQPSVVANFTNELTTSMPEEMETTFIESQAAPKYQYIFNIDTSLPFNKQSPEHQASLQCRWNHYLPPLDTIQLSRYEHDTLLSRCFSYSAAWLFGMIPDLFLCDMLEFLSPNPTRAPEGLHHYSPILHCSLLAFASPMSDDLEVRQPSIREKFATHAKYWLDQEFNHPNPSLIISLILLSEYHLAIGERNTGYMYTGMSMRATRAATNSPLRDWYCWSAFLQEQLVAREMHRLGEMPVPTGPLVSPITLEFSGQPLFEVSAAHLFGHKDYTRVAIECFIQCTKLVLIANVISAESHGSLTTNDVHIQLETWFNALPAYLLVQHSDMLTPPPVLALHIRYWWSILELYLPDSTAKPSLSTNLALVRLVELFEAFDSQFGLRYFPRNLLKALHLCGRASILEHLPGAGIDICLKGLRFWDCAELMVADLVQLRSSMDNVDRVGRSTSQSL
ncbi:unnamed protein product [Rhizoctonia solani]|uniref:Transcription factor domain-containing protein n=1 Tax=Rhizoctonia solani TaxID=456999 RepID=A0A8H3C054_9AGAM|nr:unnamed protein product [Rhizoctonia solani]